MGERSTRKKSTSRTDLFGFPTEEYNDENVEEKEEESSSSKEEPEEEKEEQDEEKNSSSEEEEREDNEPDYDPWKPLHVKVGEDLEEQFLKEVQRFLDRGKSKRLCQDCRIQYFITC